MEQLSKIAKEWRFSPNPAKGFVRINWKTSQCYWAEFDNLIKVEWIKSTLVVYRHRKLLIITRNWAIMDLFFSRTTQHFICCPAYPHYLFYIIVVFCVITTWQIIWIHKLSKYFQGVAVDYPSFLGSPVLSSGDW